MAKATGRTGKRRVGTIPLTPGAGGVFTGETVTWGGEQKLVYRELKPEHMRSEQRIMFGPDGQAMYHPAPAGAQRIPMRHRVETVPEEIEKEPNPDAYREYIIEDSGHGKGAKIFGFRPDPEVVARKAKEAARKAKGEKLMDALLESDLDPEDILQMAQKPAEEVVEEAYIKHKGFGNWSVLRGDEVLDEKMTKEAAQELVDSLAP